MNESGFTTYLLKKLKAQDIYTLKLMLNFNNGVPDCYFSGAKGDLWAEMKWIKDTPKRSTTNIEPNLSELQRRWLDNRLEEGRNVCVILGSPIGCYIFRNGEWNSKITRDDLTTSRLDVIQWILKQVS